ncbi:MAG: family 43 glycosylhydrolase [Clostridia bacterium]
MIQNPILKGFNPDPSILRVDNCYYIAVSSFEWFPGIPIYRSFDLKNWELFTHAIVKNEQINLMGMSSASAVWAPSLTYNKKTQKFYVAFSVVYGFDNNNFDVDNFYVESDKIDGTWSNAIYINSTGFDPAFFHDTDKKSYVVCLEWEAREGYEHPGYVVLQEYDFEKRSLVGEYKRISKGATDRGCTEGPNIYKKGEYYYLVTAEGGTGYGHCIAISRAKNIFGDYESYENNPIITSQPIDFSERGVGDSAKSWRYYPHSILQKSGHGSIVETDTGETYIVHLCSRPFAPELRSTLGRETSIQKCYWTNDAWIKLDSDNNMAKIGVDQPNLREYVFEQANQNKLYIEENGEKVLHKYFYTLREEFNKDWINFDKNGNILMRARGTLFSNYHQSIIARKATAFSYSATVKIDFEPENNLQMAGLVNYYNSKAFYYLRVYYSESLKSKTLAIMKSDKGFKKEYCDTRIKIESGKEIYLKSVVKERELRFYYSFDGDSFVRIGDVYDSTILSDEYAGGFTGSFVAVTASDNYTKSKTCKIEKFVIENN